MTAEGLTVASGPTLAPEPLSRVELAIRTAAVELFFRHGYDAVGIRKIASSLSIATATMYHYFPSKDQILASVMSDTNQIIYEHSVQALGDEQDPVTRFGILVAAVASIQASSPMSCYVVDNEVRSLKPDSVQGKLVLQQRQGYEQLWIDVISEGVEAAHFRTADPTIARLGLIGMMASTSLWFRSNDPQDIQHLSRTLLTMSLASLGAKLSEKRLQAIVGRIPLIRLAWEPQHADVAPSTSNWADILR